MSASLLKRISIAAAGLTLLVGATAHSANREAGWEAGFDVVYQDSAEFDFERGSKVEFDDDYGVSFTFGYRANPHLEFQFALDYADTDYSVLLVTADSNGVPTGTLTGSGEMESFTPRANVQWNLLDRPVTPFLMGGIGYAFIDTNIPNGRPQTGCWYDPWYGYLCQTVQPTKSVEEFTYQVGIGGRFDISSSLSLRVAYERHWIDISTASGTPYVDQIKLGISFR
jgi:opacity protein-like surface antigen